MSRPSEVVGLRPSRRARGFTVIHGALFGMAFIAILGLAVDTSYVVLCEHQLQNAADAAALAGAYSVRNGLNPSGQYYGMLSAENAALANVCAKQGVVLTDNPSNVATGDVVVGHYYRASDNAGKVGFYSADTPLNAVEVNATRTTTSHGAVSLFFAPMFGVNSCAISRTAIAMIGGDINAGVMVLDPHGSGALNLGGTGSRAKIQVNLTQNPGQLGAVIVNSDSATSMTGSGNYYIEADDVYFGGSDAGAQSHIPDGSAVVNQAPSADPLANLPEPAQPLTKGVKQNNVWLAGYYANGISGTLGPGIFWVDGGITGDITATSGTMIFLNTGGIGSNNITINPMTTGTYSDISIFQSRSNNSSSTIKGNDNITNTGVIYMPDGSLTFKGTPTSVGSMLIVYDLSISGNSSVVINDDGKFPVTGGQIFLVQ